MTRSCDHCGTTYDAKRSSSRYCGDTCRKGAQRARTPSAPVKAPVRFLGASAQRTEEQEPPAHADLPGGVFTATLAELVESKRESSALGLLALSLAQRVDADAMSPGSGSSVAALSRELRATLAAATAGSAKAVDPLDEIRARRDAKRAAG